MIIQHLKYPFYHTIIYNYFEKIEIAKITEEINIAIQTALNIRARFPDADIEVHADVGKTKRSRTREFVEFVRGWITGVGFVCRVKPESWASSIADWHTK